MAKFSVQNISQLITQAKQGDRAAEDELFARASGQIERMVRKRLDRDFPRLRKQGIQTLDGVQVAVVQFLTNLRRENGWDRITSERHFFKLVGYYIHWALLNMAKRPSKPTVKLPEEDLISSRTSDAFSLQTMSAFHHAVEKLPEDVRKVFKKRFYDRLSQKEAADALGVTEDTVKRRYREAKNTLHKLLRT